MAQYDFSNKASLVVGHHFLSQADMQNGTEQGISHYIIKKLLEANSKIIVTYNSTLPTPENTAEYGEKVKFVPFDVNRDGNYKDLFRVINDEFVHLDNIAFTVNRMYLDKKKIIEIYKRVKENERNPPNDINRYEVLKLSDFTSEDMKKSVYAGVGSLQKLVWTLHPLLSNDASVVAYSFAGHENLINYAPMSHVKTKLEEAIKEMSTKYNDIRFNAVSGGAFLSHSSFRVPYSREFVEEVRKLFPTEAGEVQERMANATMFLFDESSKGITGTIVLADGGVHPKYYKAVVNLAEKLRNHSEENNNKGVDKKGAEVGSIAAPISKNI